MPDPAPAVCPACAAAGPRLWGAKPGSRLQRDFRYYRCAACSYRWVEPFPGYEIYDESYYQGRGLDPYVDYAREYADYRGTERPREFEDLWRLAHRHFQPSPGTGTVRWLDYGCGAGGLLKFLRAQGHFARDGRRLPLEIAGHDIGVYADRLRERDGFSILGADSLAGTEASFDIISCIEVVEHIREVRETFRTLARLLRPGGLLLLTTGNLSGPAARLAGLNYRYLIPEIHISLFDPTCLTRLYEANSLQPLSVRYHGVVQFKILKSLRHPGLRRLARGALGLPLVTRAIDAFYGVSAMPCAHKPAG